MRVLITTPFFQYAGGSELETIHTANTIASFDKIEEVHVFVYSNYDLKFLKDIKIDRKIKFIRRPEFLENKFINKINKVLKKKLKLDSLPLDLIYWKIRFITKYEKVYILTKTSLNYYFPIIKLFKNKKNIIVKFTTVFFSPMEEVKINYLSTVGYNIVTSEKQKFFFRNNCNLLNTITQEIILYNEEYCLGKERIKKNIELYDFGILGRFSEEKQFEHAIYLIENLRKKGYEASLIIKGGCNYNYYTYLLNLVKEKELEKLVSLDFREVPYNKVYDFFDCFNCLLITSLYEGGPNIGLEIMAYGLPILSYNVGAMEDRLNKFNEFIADDEEELTNKAIEILNYNDEVFLSKCKCLKKEYISKYSNQSKVDFLNNFLIRD